MAEAVEGAGEDCTVLPAEACGVSKTSGDTSGKLVAQPHGGALRQGGTGAGGRPPSEIRKAARLAFDERIARLADIADHEDTKDSDKIKAIEVLGNFGFGKDLSIAAVREKVAKTIELVR